MCLSFWCEQALCCLIVHLSLSRLNTFCVGPTWSLSSLAGLVLEDRLMFSTGLISSSLNVIVWLSLVYIHLILYWLKVKTLQTCQPCMEENDATSQKDTDDEWIQMDVFTDDNICDNELVQPPNVSDQCTQH